MELLEKLSKKSLVVTGSFSACECEAGCDKCGDCSDDCSDRNGNNY